MNPVSKAQFNNIYNRYGKITNNKSWEFEIYKHDQNLLEFELDTSFIGKDHAGVSISLGLFSYVISARLYDTRHWDYTNHCWREHENRDET